MFSGVLQTFIENLKFGNRPNLTSPLCTNKNKLLGMNLLYKHEFIIFNANNEVY